MAWTTPRTWVSGELVTHTLLNTHLRDNLNALKAPSTDYYNVNEVSDYTTTSSSFVDVDATDLAMTITTSGGDVFVHFHGTVSHSAAAGRTYFEVAVDGVAAMGDDGILHTRAAASPATESCAFTLYITGLSAASHTFKLQWKTSGATATLYAGAGTSTGDLHPQFWAREIS